MKVPVYSAGREQDPRGTGARIDPRAGGLVAGTLANSTLQLAGTFGEMAEREEKARQAIEVTRMSAGATREVNELMLGLERDPDWSKGRERYDQGVEDIRKRWGEKTQDAAVRQKFEAQLGQFAESHRATLGRKLLETGEKQAQGALVESLEQHSRLAAYAPNPLARQQALQAGEEAIETMRAAGWISDLDAANRRKGFRGRVDEAVVLGKLNASTEEGTLGVIQELRGGAYANLDPVATERLIKAAESQATRLADQKARAEEKTERLAGKAAEAEGDALLKNIHQLHSQQKPIDELVSRARTHPGVKPAEYNALLRLQAGGDPKDDDPATLADLAPRLHAEDLTADLSRALLQKKIRGETYISLLERNKAAFKDDQPASPFKSGRELVNLSLKPPEVLGAGAAQDAARFAQAEALAEYDSWAEANRGANRETHLTEARNVVQRYQAIQFDRLSMAVGLPRGVTGTRSDLTAEQLDAAERATLQRLDAGGMTRDMAAGELRKIEAWREILARRPKKEPAKK